MFLLFLLIWFFDFIVLLGLSLFLILFYLFIIFFFYCLIYMVRYHGM